MGPRVDAVLLGLLAVWGSIAAHGVAFVALVAALSDVPAPEVLEFEIVHGAVASSSSEGPAALDPPAADEASSTAEAGPPGAPAVVDDAAPVERQSWRARLAAREADHEARQAVIAARMETLRAAFPAPTDAAGGVARCRDLEGFDPLPVVPVRDLGRVAPMMPRGVLPLAYIEQIGELARRRTARGWEVDIALPPRIVPVAFDDPPGTIAAIGREDVRCAVTLTVTRALFPMRLFGLPVQIVDVDGVVGRAVIDVELGVDASVTVLSSRGGTLPFTRAFLARQEKLKETLEGHASTFVAMQALADLVGLE